MFMFVSVVWISDRLFPVLVMGIEGGHPGAAVSCVYVISDRLFPVLVMAESMDILEQLSVTFKKFAVHGDHKATGKELNGKNWAKLCKDCNIADGKTTTSTDVDIVFTKVK